MALRLYDSLSREVRPFVTREPKKARLYVCGVTVYDYCHIGHARAYLAFDVLVRWLLHSGYEVVYVRNFTDVDDKIIQRANERGVPTDHITSQFIEAFHEDMAKLGLLPATIEPKATEHIPEMIEVIERLLAKGLAYVVGGDVWFSVPSYPQYGRLSRKPLDELREGARVAVSEEKRDPADFALWKAAKPGEPSWDSPWGKGRPGWHIECSAMARKHLGQPIDLHGGGADLVFPHHENEIAQSEGAYGEPLSSVWMHNGFVNVDDEKMSKSLGNFFTIRDVLAKYPGEAIRMFTFNAHYRKPLNFTDVVLDDAVDKLARLYSAVAAADDVLRTHPDRTLSIGPATGPENEAAAALAERVETRFREAMDDDLNTADATSVLFEVARAMNAITSRPALNSGEHDLLAKLRHELVRHASVLGLLGEDAATWMSRHRTAGAKLDSREIDAKIAERAAARKAKDFAKADEIRRWLDERGIVLEDKGGLTTWKVKAQ